MHNKSDKAADVFVENSLHYTDSERWQRERQRFFIDTPQLVGFAGEIAEPGSYLTTTVMDVPIVITRAEDGKVRAFLNACAHRGARVASGCGTRKRLNCMFHGWSYGLDGKLAGRPADADFCQPGEKTDLLPLPVSEKYGLLVVACHAGISQQQVDSFLDPMAPALKDFSFESLRPLETRKLDVKAHWKLVVNLSLESYHFSVLHRESLSPFMTDHFVMDSYDIHSRWAFPMKGIETLDEKPESEWPAHLPAIINHTVFPGTILIANPKDAQIIRAEPGAIPGQSVVYYSGAFALDKDQDEAAQKTEALNAYNFGGEIFRTEDLMAAEQCQQALDAGLPQMLFGRNEPVVQFWHQLWKEMLERKPAR